MPQDAQSPDLYDQDIMSWSREQASRLRRVAAGERVNDVDWAHVIEEVEDVGKSLLRAVQSHLRLAMLHALKVTAFPDSDAVPHWNGEIAGFLARAKARFELGMQQHLDLAALYQEALRDIRRMPTEQGPPPRALPEVIEFCIAELRDPDFGAIDLLDRIAAAQAVLPRT